MAFTYIELLIASAVLLMIALALVSSNIFGLRIRTMVEQQNDARQLRQRVTETLSRSIREAHRVEVGSMAWGGPFLVPTNGAAYVGNGVRLTYVDSGVTNTLIYFQEGTELKQSLNDDWLNVPVVVSNVITAEPFMAVDAARCATNSLRDLGPEQALTNSISRPLVRVWLELSTLGGQSLNVGPNTAFTGSEILFSAAPRGN